MRGFLLKGSLSAAVGFAQIALFATAPGCGDEGGATSTAASTSAVATGTGGADGSGGGAGGAAGQGGQGGAPQVCVPGLIQPCYTGPDGTENVGICKGGFETCEPDGSGFGPCDGQITPFVETCNTPSDDDCDGLVNEEGTGCAGIEIWVKSYGDASPQKAVAVAVDGAGNVIVAGDLAGSADFGGGVLTSAGQNDIFVVKLDAAGGHLWSERFGGPGNQHARGVAVDAAGDVVVAGFFEASVDFGGGALASAGSMDIYVARLSGSAGAHLSSTRFGDAGMQRCQGLAAAPSGVLLTGSFDGSVDFGGGALTSAGGQDVFVTMLDATGKHVFSKAFGGPGDQVGTGVAAGPAGSAIVTGSFGGEVSFGGPLLVSADLDDIFAAKLGSLGEHAWSKAFGGAGNQSGAAVAVDPAGDVWLTGAFDGSVDFGGGALTSAGGLDGYIAKLSGAGEHLFSKRFGDVGDQLGTAMAADGSSNPITAGHFEGKVDFGSGALTSAGQTDIFVAKASPLGAPAWSKRLGDDTSQLANAVAVDATGKILVAGSFQGDVFVAKLAP